MAEILNIHQRIAAVMADVTYIQKERKEKMQYSIVSHDKVTAKVRPALLKAGIIYYPVRCDHTQNGNRAEASMTIRFVNIDEPTDFIDVQTFGYGVDTSDKGPGKAMSYAVKYALLKCLGLETGDDADHDEAPHEKQDPATKEPPKPEQVRDYLTGGLKKQTSDNGLENVWGHADFVTKFDALPEPMQNEVKAAYTEMRTKLEGKT